MDTSYDRWLICYLEIRQYIATDERDHRVRAYRAGNIGALCAGGDHYHRPKHGNENVCGRIADENSILELSMKIILDQVQPDGDRYVAYLKLMDGERVVATKTIPYELGKKGFDAKVQDKFKAVITEWKTKQAGIEQARQEIETALAVIEAGKEK
jgi:hypothetical protein